MQLRINFQNYFDKLIGEKVRGKKNLLKAVKVLK